MLATNFFLPTLYNDPQEAKIISHKLLLRAGYIRQTASGIYSFLPLGLRVLNKIIDIIRKEHDKIGAIEMLMPTLQSAELWQRSGRYEAYGLEMLRIKDRHDKPMLYGPTNEEQITEIMSEFLRSYKDLPKIFYHTQWKFRDEIRPRFGLMRGREFLMKDAYSFDKDKASAEATYHKMAKLYLNIFKEIGLQALLVKADSGAIGGDLSHEVHILASNGESTLYYDSKLTDMDLTAMSFEQLSNLYAVAEEKYDANNLPANIEVRSSKGIEVGQLFYFGGKYSEPLKANYVDRTDTRQPYVMGSYGIGVSRLLAAIVESSHDEAGIIWPSSVAPFTVSLIDLNQGVTVEQNANQSMFGNESVGGRVYQMLLDSGIDVLYDNREMRLGAKCNDLDLIGIPVQIIIPKLNHADAKTYTSQGDALSNRLNPNLEVEVKLRAKVSVPMDVKKTTSSFSNAVKVPLTQLLAHLKQVLGS